MIRNLKALGLALVAVFALSAVSSSAASAEKSIFDSASASTVLTATSENTQIFTRSGVEIKCTHAKFFTSAPVVGTSVSTIELKAEYTTPTCSGPLGSEVHVDFTTNGCAYAFTGTASLTANPELKCTNAAGVKITPTAFGSSLCTITVIAQQVGGHVTFKNIANGDVTGEATASGIGSTRTGSELCGTAINANGTYTGNVIIEGETNATPPVAVNINVT